MRVVIRDESSMNLLGLMLKSKLEKATAPVVGELFMAAGPMQVALKFAGDSVEIARESVHPTARITGSLRALLDCACGRGLLWSFATRAIRVGGDPRLLWRFAQILRAR